RVADSIKSIMNERSSSTGIALSKRDLPKFQLKSAAVKYFPGEEAFDSVFHFLRNFEKVVGSAGQDVEVMWRNYLPLTIPYEYDEWLKQELVKCRTWKEVGVEFVRKFNNPLLRLNARRAVQSAAMQGGETVEGYYNRFSRSCAEAGYDAADTSIGDAFLNGFPNEWQIQVTTLLCTSFPGATSWTVGQISSCAMNILNTKKCPFSFVGRAAAAGGSGGVNIVGAAGKSAGGSRGTTGGGNNNGSFGSTKSYDEGKRRNLPTKATGTNFCSHCGKQWVAGHSCPEYFANMRVKQNLRVLSVRKVAAGDKAGQKKRQRRRHNHKKKDRNVAAVADVSESAESNWF
ncbi:hypothetical protein, partial, partial [Parasitella parasitica]